MKIDIKLEGMDALMKRLDPKAIEAAVKKSITRAANSGKTIISQQVREEFNLKKADVDKSISIDLSNLRNLQATIRITGKPISLTYFNPQQMRGSVKTFISKNRGIAQRQQKRPKYSGVRVQIIKGRPVTLTPAFIARGQRSGAPFVFERIGKSRLPLRAMKVVTIPTILSKPGNMAAVKERITEQLKKETISNLKYYMGGVR